jgi:hypothetical protein
VHRYPDPRAAQAHACLRGYYAASASAAR